jgi:hypothetical protein
LTFANEDWSEVRDSLEMTFFSWLDNCSIDDDRSFSFRWNGSERSRIIQSPIRWVVTGLADFVCNGFSMMLMDGVGGDFVVWQYSVWHTLSGMSVVVVRGVAEKGFF